MKCSNCNHPVQLKLRVQLLKSDTIDCSLCGNKLQPKIYWEILSALLVAVPILIVCRDILTQYFDSTISLIISLFIGLIFSRVTYLVAPLASHSSDDDLF